MVLNAGARPAVYVRVRDEEWNVYRRYSAFRSLHHSLRKQHPLVDSFKLPPKKALGNKDSRFVEGRRRQLQDYLRLVVNKVVQANSNFTAEPSKSTLTGLHPFFLEEFLFPGGVAPPSSRRVWPQWLHEKWPSSLSAGLQRMTAGGRGNHADCRISLRASVLFKTGSSLPGALPRAPGRLSIPQLPLRIMDPARQAPPPPPLHSRRAPHAAAARPFIPRAPQSRLHLHGERLGSISTGSASALSPRGCSASRSKLSSISTRFVPSPRASSGHGEPLALRALPPRCCCCCAPRVHAPEEEEGGGTRVSAARAAQGREVRSAASHSSQRDDPGGTPATWDPATGTRAGFGRRNWDFARSFVRRKTTRRRRTRRGP
ncbi:unnamed protein product [Lampetra fluviatilis]